MARGTGGYSLTRRNISTYLRIRPLAVNKDPEKVRESWRLDNLPYGADSGLEFVIFLPLSSSTKIWLRLSRDYPPEPLAKPVSETAFRVSERARARKLDERGMPWRWSLESRNQGLLRSG